MRRRIKEFLPDIKRWPADQLWSYVMTALASALGTVWVAYGPNPPQLNNLEWLALFVGGIFATLAIALAIVWVAGFARSIWRRAFSAGPTRNEAAVEKSNAPPQPAFLIRFPEKRQGVIGERRGIEAVLEIEVVNAVGRHFTSIEVHVDGETNATTSRNLDREKVRPVYLRSRTDRRDLKPGQSETFVLMSRLPDGQTFWGDHKLLAEDQRVSIPHNAQCIFEVSVLAAEVPPTRQKFVVINASKDPQFFPVSPRATAYINCYLD